MSIKRLRSTIAALAAFSISTAIAAGRCQLQQIGVMPVEMQGLRPLVWTKINGAKARFELDSGAFYSTISRDAAGQYKLPVTPVPSLGFYITGVGGAEKTQLASTESFEFLGVPLSGIRFLVVNQNLWEDAAAGALGQNLLRLSDVEYDLANGLVRFIKPVGCADQPLAYWAVSTPYSSVDLKYMDVVRSHALGTAMVNGRRITVEFDTGSGRSLLSLDAAGRAGITPSSPGVKFLGLTRGFGPEAVKLWVAPVETFQIGGERVEHTHLLIGDVHSKGPDMLLGDDFFLSHRIYVAYSQSKLYFTYNGGPLFNLDVPPATASTAKPPASPGATSQAGETTGDQPGSNTPTDADGFRRRGMAYAAMREFARAIADLTSACDLAPKEADNHYQRGLIYAQDGQLKSALQDYDAAITLQSNDMDAYLARAQLLHSHPDVDPAAAPAEVKSDLDAVSRLAAPTANIHLGLGAMYEDLGDYSTAIEQTNQWLDTHPLKGQQAIGLNDRCWFRAEANRDLQEALDDCNHALDLIPAEEELEKSGFYSHDSSHIQRILETPEHPDILDSRGLVHLRLGNLKDAVRDYDSALHLDPKLPAALYGRGLAELQLGEKVQGQADLAAAEKLDSGIGKRFAGMGLTP